MDTHTDSDLINTAPTPEVKKKSGPSLVWLVPLITAIIGGWLIFKTLSEKGPEISIIFKSAEGIEAGKTKIKYKEIEIGVVNSVHFSKDFSNVILKVSIAKEAELFLRRDTRFWVVKPRLSLRGVSNLSTLLSGVYIEIEPGHGAPHKNFIGLEVAPVIKADVAGKKIVLLAKKLGSIDTGSPIYYQGVLAGEVLGYELGNDRKSVFIHAFIKSPYDELVQSNTRFWNVSGVDVTVGTEGINIRTESFQSILFGGIAFDTSDTLEQVKKDVEGLVFTLYNDFKSIQKESFTKKIVFILFFEGSIRGLNIGAPVEFKGIKVGSVVDVRLEFDSRNTSFRIPVLIEIEPERVITRKKSEVSSPYQLLKTLVDRGLRARLQTGSLLTGQLFVELDMHPGTPVHLVNEEGFPELPTIPTGGMGEIAASIQAVLKQIEKVDLEQIAKELLSTLQVANKLINTQEAQNVMRNLKESLHSLKSILRKVDQRAEPITTNIGKVIKEGHEALKQINEVLRPDSPLQHGIIELSDELAEAARSIRIFVDLLERNPNSIIFGKRPSGEK